MRGGTTQPTLSEDLWAQVAALKPGTAHWGRISSTVRDAAEGGSKRGSPWRHGGVGLNFGEARGRLLTELTGA